MKIHHRLSCAVLVAACLASCGPAGDSDRATATDGVRATRRDDFDRLMAAAQVRGSVRVIVGMRMRFTPEGELGAEQVAAQRRLHRALHDAVMRQMAGTTYRMMRDYEAIPYMAMDVAPDALATLGRSGAVGVIVEDREQDLALADSARIVEATEAQSLGRSGAGQTIAVLDTGIERDHFFLAGKVVEEACYTDGDCPNGEATQLGAGAGAPCTYASTCGHGTHVAGIAAGGTAADTVAFSGVARGATLMSVQVFSRRTTGCLGGASVCARAVDSDIIAGLERVYARRAARRFAAVNMSLGGGGYANACDTLNPAMTDAIANLRAAGIATVIASGNSGFTNGVAYPACISHAISVGATTKGDAVAGFSNSAGGPCRARPRS